MAEKKPAAKKRKKTSQKYRMYAVSGSNLERKNKQCPKCGAGVFMAKHADRLTCGRCGYTEFVKKGK
jgi:small subunit ribosomal protein S27Ae